MAFSEYPKAMSHPGFRPAVISKDEYINGKVIKAPPGQPAKFPPVYVNNEDQEAQYSAMGYVPNGVADPDAYHAAMAGIDKPATYQHMDFPKYLYQSIKHEDATEGDIWVADAGRWTRGVLLNDEAAQDRLTGDWYATPGDAALAGDSEATEEDEQAQEDAQEQPNSGRRRKG